MSITSSLRWFVASKPEKRRSPKKQHRRRLNVEHLESRLMLAAPEPVSIDPESPLANSHTVPTLANVSLTFDTFGETLDDNMLDEKFVAAQEIHSQYAKERAGASEERAQELAGKSPRLCSNRGAEQAPGSTDGNDGGATQ